MVDHPFGWQRIALLVSSLIVLAFAISLFIFRSSGTATSAADEQSLRIVWQRAIAADGYLPPKQLIRLLARSAPRLHVIVGGPGQATTGRVVIDRHSTVAQLTLYGQSADGQLLRLQGQGKRRGRKPVAAITTLGPFKVAASALSAGALRYWPLSDRKSCSGCSLVPGPNGQRQAIQLNGKRSKAAVALPETLNRAKALTVELWAKPSSLDSYQQLLSSFAGGCGHYGGFGIALAGGQWSGSVAAGCRSANVGSVSPSPSTASWSQVVLVYNPAAVHQLQLIVNDTLSGYIDRASYRPSGSPLRLGSIRAAAGFYSGALADLAVYPTALSCGASSFGQRCNVGSQIDRLFSAH